MLALRRGWDLSFEADPGEVVLAVPRARGHFDVHGKLNRIGFGLGTALTFAKEVFRLIVVEHRLKGFGELVRGWRDGRAIWADKTWQPMPPLETGVAE